MKRFKGLFLLSVIVMLVFVTACSDSTTGGSAGKDGEKGVVNIGYSGPLSGAAAFYGERTLNGLKMAAEEINDEGGFEVNGKTYTINLVPLDDKYLPNETASNAKRLVQEHKTPIIFTPHSGGVLALQVFNEVDNFIIGAYTSEPSVTEGGNKLTVQIPPKYDGYVEPFTNYTMKRFGKKIAALPTSSQYGKDWTETLLPYWKKQGGEVVYESSINFAKDTDFFTVITNALKKKPDVLFIGGASEPTAKVAKQARELGFKGGFIVMDQAKLNEMEQITGSYEVLEGAVGVLPLIYSKAPGVPSFKEKYNAKYKENPGSEAGIHYIGLHAFVEAMKAAGTVDDPKKIYEHVQDGLDAIPEERKTYLVPKITEAGSFDYELHFGVVEDGEIKEMEAE